MSRLTRKKDLFDCRIGNRCMAEDWIETVTGVSEYHWHEHQCEHCPFMKYINALAEYEDNDKNEIYAKEATYA